MSRTLVFILALMLSLQSMIAVADLHLLHPGDNSHFSVIADAHADHHDKPVLAESVDAVSDPAATQAADSEHCHHCCHCHHGSVHFLAGHAPYLFSNDGSAGAFAKGTSFTSWISSPDFRPPIA